MSRDIVGLTALLDEMTELWLPHRVATVNDYDVKVAKIQGDFVEHAHDDTDEFFLVLDGELVIELPDREVRLRPHDVFVVPKGVRHRPTAAAETTILMFEPRGTVNTGDVGGELTREPVDI
jgi:mannose-6-phosphate isomerase-like protein (cupin superfamily)